MVKKEKLLDSYALSTRLSVWGSRLGAKPGSRRPAPYSQPFLLAAHTHPTQWPCHRIHLGKQECYHFIPTRMANIKKTGNNKVDEDVGKLEPSDIDGANVKWCSCYGR